MQADRLPHAGGLEQPIEGRRAAGRAAREETARRGRRRPVDPTGDEAGFAAAEEEFMRAMEEYRRRSGRMFPTWSEVLEVLQGLGYEKVAAPAVGPDQRRREEAGGAC